MTAQVARKVYNSMTSIDPNEMNTTGGADNSNRHTSGGQSQSGEIDRPYGDAGNLYEIPRVRPDDPPLRRWWIDDEPQNDNSSSD